jgi:hypothetical protein
MKSFKLCSNEMLSGCKKINCSQRALELSQDRENEKNTRLHFVNMSIN